MGPGLWVVTDESGSGLDRTRSVAAVAGPPDKLRRLEAELGRVLAQEGIAELKWAQVRTRPARLRAAHAFMSLAEQARGKGLWVGAVIWRPARRRAQGTAPASAGARALRHLRPLRDDMADLVAAYGRLVRAAASAWPRSSKLLLPDQRTGIDFGEVLAAGGGMPSGWSAYALQRSDERPLVQLADLVAGSARFKRDEARALAALGSPPPARLPAWRKRLALVKEHPEAFLTME